jgi:hypothetical protein
MQNKKDSYFNSNGHCHDEKSTMGITMLIEGTFDNSQSAEELCDVKASHTVLKPSVRGDLAA